MLSGEKREDAETRADLTPCSMRFTQRKSPDDGATPPAIASLHFRLPELLNLAALQETEPASKSSPDDESVCEWETDHVQRDPILPSFIP